MSKTPTGYVSRPMMWMSLNFHIEEIFSSFDDFTKPLFFWEMNGSKTSIFDFVKAFEVVIWLLNLVFQRQRANWLIISHSKVNPRRHLVYRTPRVPTQATWLICNTIEYTIIRFKYIVSNNKREFEHKWRTIIMS